MKILLLFINILHVFPYHSFKKVFFIKVLEHVEFWKILSLPKQKSKQSASVQINTNGGNSVMKSLEFVLPKLAMISGC